ncbi:YebC/PmpR family DNA-binding transcriptional regulator [Patescibacteria group bacterium]|nr:YebC/PmpR family DNA-binding transcriptional regulator [Patescibacteria group bacterium]
MAGHSKWKQIKEKKGKEDKKRSKEFSKFARLISVESRLANGDVNSPNLRTVIERARTINMPKENIARAVERGTGAGGATLEQITYETYGPGGVAVLIDTFTDSKNRTSQELKHLLSEMGYALATPGSASWAFSKDTEGAWQATTTIPLSDEDAEKLDVLVEALEARDDVENVSTNAE